MAAKTNLCQYVIFIKPRNLDTADIKCFTVLNGHSLISLASGSFMLAFSLSAQGWLI